VGCSSKKEGLVTKTKRKIWQQEKGQKRKRTHRSSVGKERIAHDIRIIGHDTSRAKPSKGGMED